jgi:histidinol-phosphate aminotransferase
MPARAHPLVGLSGQHFFEVAEAIALPGAIDRREQLAREFGLDASKIVKLASNENPLGMPDSAKQALNAAVANLGRYPDPAGFDLKKAISQRFGVDQGWLTLGNGSNDILELVASALIEPGSAVVYSQFAFVVYRLATQARGAKHIVVAAKEHGHDLPAMLEAITPETKIVYVANPNNPTGTYLSVEAIESFLASVAARHGTRVTVVLDEAYNEFLEPALRVDGVALVKRYPNLIVSRSFSKAYGLAGLRVGFAMAQPVLTDLLNRVRQPFNVNSLAQAAAIAALNDKEFLAKSFALNRDGKKQLQQGFEKLALQFVPSYANFVLVKVGDAARINLELLKRGVIVRPVAGDGLPEWLRVSIGLPHENQTFLDALTAILKTAPGP